MEKEEIAQAVKEIISEIFSIDIKTIEDESALEKDLGIDSLAIFNLHFNLQKKFKIEIPIERIWAIKNVNQTIDLIYTTIGQTNNGGLNE